MKKGKVASGAAEAQRSVWTWRPRRLAPWMLAVIVLFTAVAYGPALEVPFLGDDYVFLDKTRSAGFLELWSRANTDFGWYRPWSRELHFWFFQGAFGPHEIGFRVVNLVLWCLALGLYWVLLRGIAGDRTASLATLGIASLSMWGAPLSWISGAQDLWMLVFALLALLLDERRLVPWAMGATMLALLSKETAAAIPLVVFAKARFLDGRDWRGGAGRALPYVAIMLAWLFLHPVLLHRLAHPTEQPTTGDHPLALWEIVLRSLLSLVNLDRWDLRVDPDAWRPVATFAAALLLSLAAYAATRFRPVGAAAIAPVRRGVIAFGAAWCVSGWLPLFSPSVGWHAYYGCLGAMGGWLAIAAALERFPMPAAAIVLVLGILRGVAAASPSWDWGSEWYQTRAGNMLRTIRTQLKELHPTLPPHSRLYFGSIPNNIGLVAGRSPAVRIWYGDSTLAAGFYTYYRPRTGSPSQGQDLFFHFDSTVGIREVLPDVPPPAGLEPGSAWERDHESLAMALLTAGDASRAARLFEHIASLPHRPEALLYAGVCWEAAGDPGRAAMSFDSIRARTGASPTEIATLASRLRATMPKVRSPQP